MFQKLKIVSLLPIIAFLIFSCNSAAQSDKKSGQNSDISSISYRHTFGRGGATEITATKDSLISSSVGGRVKDVPNFKKKMNPDDWKKLVSGINISTLEKTESGKGRGHYDGPDEIFEIKTSEKEYKLVNVPDSLQRKQLVSLKTLLQTLVSKEK